MDFKTLYNCIDLTSLTGEESEPDIKQLCEKAVHPLYGHVAAVCVYLQAISTVKKYISNSAIKLATVVNFPKGDLPFALLEKEVILALELAVDEIDIVVPYHTLKENINSPHIYECLVNVKQMAPNVRLKAILETGVLTAAEIEKACQFALAADVDFLKTSTGKVHKGASLEAAHIMLLSIKKHFERTGKRVGFKASGGVVTLEQAAAYAELACQYLGPNYLKPETFRVGASRLVDALIHSG